MGRRDIEQEAVLQSPLEFNTIDIIFSWMIWHVIVKKGGEISH